MNFMVLGQEKGGAMGDGGRSESIYHKVCVTWEKIKSKMWRLLK